MAYYQSVAVPQKNCSTAHVVIAWIFAVLTGLYFLPWAIAATRDKRSSISIMLVNLFLGWTLAGWVWALVWACLQDPVTIVTPAPQVAYVAPVVVAPVAAIPAYQPAPVYQQPPVQQYQQPASYASAPQYQPSAPTYQPSAPQYQASAPQPTNQLPTSAADPYPNYGKVDDIHGQETTLALPPASGATSYYENYS